MRCERHNVRAAAIFFSLALAATCLAAMASPSLRPAGASAAPARSRPPATVARQTIDRYFTLLDRGRGAEFCTTAITAATLRAQGGLRRCTERISGYVHGLERRSFDAALYDLHVLFTMVSDAVNLHCDEAPRCPSSKFLRWTQQASPERIEWRASSNPRLASSSPSRVVAVVDPHRSSLAWITLYYQSWDGRILRASWSTKPGGWKGSVVDTRAGPPFVSLVRVLDATRTGPHAIVARVVIRVGTSAPQREEFRLLEAGGAWRADTWRALAPPPSM